MIVSLFLLQKVQYEEFEMAPDKRTKKSSEKVIDESMEGEVEAVDDVYSSVEEGNEISEYEKLRLKNLEENRRIMM